MQDLSHLLNLETGLTAGESMSAGNTVSPSTGKTAMAAPGSMPVNIPSAKPRQHDDPGLEIPAEDENINKPKFGSSPTSSGSWEKAGK